MASFLEDYVRSSAVVSVEDMIEDCEDQEDRLTDWERAFIDGISAVGENRITGRQLDKLTEIWSRVTTTD